MPTRAYILIETTVGQTGNVADALRAIPEVVRVDTVTGPYDVIAIAETADLPGIGSLIGDDMHSIPGISKTVSCLGISS